MSSRVRVRFTKLGKIRWTSHRDVARMWERAFRRVQLPLAYTAGFSPRPKVSFGLALPTGCESVAEYLDFETTDGGLDVRTLPLRLSPALPSGVDVTAAAWIEPSTPSLQEDVFACTWRWAAALGAYSRSPAVAGRSEALEERVVALMQRPAAVVTRSRKGQPVTEDVRPAILDVRVVAAPPGKVDPDFVWLQADLATKPRALRPADVLSALAVVGGQGPERPGAGGANGGVAEAVGLEDRDVRRLNQWMWRDGARQEPLPADGPAGATSAPHALERAS